MLRMALRKETRPERSRSEQSKDASAPIQHQQSAPCRVLPPLREVIARHGIAAKKSLGQNFILDLNLTRRIARGAGRLDNATIIEIGPGPGGLTRALLEEGSRRGGAPRSRPPRPPPRAPGAAGLSGRPPPGRGGPPPPGPRRLRP